MLKQYLIAIAGPHLSLKPLTIFFDHTPMDDASYIILQHLPKSYQTRLGDILQRHSRLKIVQATRGASVEKDRVYYAPPSNYLTIKDGTFQFAKRPAGPNRSIDTFMESLAANENRRKVIAILLSGHGPDGVRGAAAIRKAGGLVIVQSPETCEFPQLPRKVIQDGNADFVLLPEDMPVIIQGYINRPVVKEGNR